jgi:hypothetical protein
MILQLSFYADVNAFGTISNGIVVLVMPKKKKHNSCLEHNISMIIQFFPMKYLLPIMAHQSQYEM